MSKLRIISLIIFVLVGLTGFILYPCTALSALPKTSISITSPTLYGWSVPYGQKIAFKVRVCVDKDSPAPLVGDSGGFYIQIALIKPYGRSVSHTFFIHDRVNPGECKEYTIKHDKFVADQIGIWRYIIVLYVKINNKWYKLDQKQGTFTVHGIPKAEIHVEEVGKDGKIELGQKITFKVKICVKKESPVPINGFRIFITLQKPDGEQLNWQITRPDKINPGECKRYIFKLLYTADQIGTWKYVVTLYSKQKLDEKSGTFEVYGIPKAKIEVLDIVGYATTASMICAGLALILSRIIIR